MTTEEGKEENGEIPTSEASSPIASTVVEEVAGPRRLHVTNLPFRMKNEDLNKIFEEFGKVDEAEIIYNERGSKGFGFVTMVCSEDANKAREALNRKEFDGRCIEVNNATPRQGPKGVFRGRGIGRRDGFESHNRFNSRLRQTHQYNNNNGVSQHSRYQSYEAPYKTHYGNTMPYHDAALGYPGYGQNLPYVSYGSQDNYSSSIYPTSNYSLSSYNLTYDQQQQQPQVTTTQYQQHVITNDSNFYPQNSSYRYQPY